MINLEKIKINSFFPLFGSSKFIFYDQNMAKNITEEGKKQIKLLKQTIK